MNEAPARILFVEDDPTLSEFISMILEQESYQVTCSHDGEDALQKARTELPDLILLDVLLPRMSGFEVCQRLRQDPATCLIPIIMVTSLAGVKDRITSFKLGADEYVSKPFEPMELLARLERLLQRSRQDLASNPLTGLPGGVAMEQEIQRRLASGAPFTVGLADINGLADFNHISGYEKGDHVIRLMGMILRSAAVELGNRNDMVAHLGGDNFGIISTPARAEVVAARALENADVLLPMQYEEADRVRGHVERPWPDEQNMARFPFVSFAIGLADIAPGAHHHHAEVSDQARRALASAKERGANTLVSIN